jgi:1,4-dihydroxy-2-naphthoate octaprenyltransferase
MTKIGIWLRETRPEFLTASILPVFLGTAMAHRRTGAFDPLLFALTLAGAALLHIGTNVANDYFDHRSGNDPGNVRFVRPFTGGSRLIQEGLLSPREVLAISIAAFAAAVAVGGMLTYLRGPVVLLFGLVGLASGFFYTAPPVALANRGLGELAIGVNFGLLIVTGTYWVQTGSVTREAITASMPLAFLIAAVVFVNEFQDMESDARVGKRTLVVRLGLPGAASIYALLTGAAYFPIFVGVASRVMPPLTLIAAIPYLLNHRAAAVVRRHYGDSKLLAPANALTIASHALTGLLLTIAYLAP